MKKILLTGAYKYSEKQLELIKDLGLDIDFQQYESEKVENSEKYNAVVCNSLFESNNIKNFKKLEYVQLTSAGYDRVSMKYIKENNIEIKNARGVYSVPIAEHTIMLILELMRNSKFYYENQNNHEWKKNRRAIELYKKTAVIAGCGSIGLEIAKRLKAFDMNVIGLDICYIDSDYLNECENINELNKIANKADVFISAMPYTESTHHIFDNSFFHSMKSNSIFVNISRGKVVDEQALVKALKQGVIIGAAIDVFEEEPLQKDNEIWDLNNLIITPHNSFVGDGNVDRMFKVIYDNLKEYVLLRGENIN